MAYFALFKEGNNDLANEFVQQESMGSCEMIPIPGTSLYIYDCACLLILSSGTVNHTYMPYITYCITKVTASVYVSILGETALSVAKSNNLKHIIKEAWVEQTKCSQSSVDLMDKASRDDVELCDQVGSPDSLSGGPHDPHDGSHDLMMSSPASKSCFITQVGVVT